VMRRSLPIVKLQLIATAVLLACACNLAAPSPTPGPTATLTLTPMPTATLTPTPLPTFTPPPTLTPLPAFEPWPTPTIPEPSARRGIFTNPDYGVTLEYPEGWEANVIDDPDTSMLVQFTGADGTVYANLVVFSGSAGETPEDAAAEIRAAYVEFLSRVTIIRDEMIRLGDGREAWTVLLTGVWPDGTALAKLNLTVAVRGGRVYLLQATGAPAAYDRNAAEIEALIRSLHLEVPSVYGIPRDQVLVLSGGESTNPRGYDPATTHGRGDDRVFSGLVSFDPDLNIVPDLAESWQVEGGTVYTFTLRADARFHDGRPVTAHDVVYSWERAADPAIESDTVLTYLGDIVGVKEMYEGKADRIAGLEVVDDHTLCVTIDAPKPYFLYKLTYSTAYVVDRANVESGPDWYRTPNGTGPYRLARWDRFEFKLYERNESYHLEQPAIPYVAVKLYAGSDMRLYEMGDIDMTGVGYWNVPRVMDPDDPLHADLVMGTDLCTSYVIFDAEQPPFDVPQVRQAFSMAFDREQYMEVLLNDIGIPAKGLYPPGLPGYNADLEGLPYDPARARQLLAESRYGGPEGLPLIVYTSSGIGNDSGGVAAALAEMWQRNLGVGITIENLESDKYLDKIHAGEHGQVFTSGWCADYPDPENFADVLFYTDAQGNLGNYSNPELDALLERARVEEDVAARMRMYQEVEQIIVEDAAVLFLDHGLSYVLVKPHIQGYVLTPIGVPLERFLWIDPEKLE
jgi:oligopeptide transport system substrate-binding protein